MAHSLMCGTTMFIFHSDLSGDVIIRDAEARELSVPGGDLMSFVADYVRRRRIAELEDAAALDILGFKSRDT